MAGTPTVPAETNHPEVYSKGSPFARAAMAYARRSIPVFPLRPGTKEPFHGSRGFYDATTDPEIVRRWWLESPSSNVAIPTGPASGLLVIDVDPDDGGLASLEALEAEHGPLPDTTTVRTGRGGEHHYFRYPDDGEPIRNSAGRLGFGIDVRATGGYVVAPPSVTEAPYEWRDRRRLAKPPAWLLEALRQPHSAATGSTRAASPALIPAEGDTIPEGTRNVTLTAAAGRMRSRGADELDILEGLRELNANKCLFPLPDSEIAAIARSVARYPAGSTGAKPDAAALELVDAVERGLWGREWRGVGELSARDVMVSVVKMAREHGRVIPAGVRVSISVRELALRAAVSKPTAIKAIKRLREAGLVRRDDAGRKSTEAGALVLIPPRANFDHSTTPGRVGERNLGCGKALRAPFTAPRLCWSAPEIRRLGKGCGAVLDALERAGGSATIGEIADALNKARPRDLRRRVVARLEATGVVEWSGETVSLAPTWLENLDGERGIAGELDVERRNRDRYERERVAFANRHRNRPDRVPRRHARPRGADGFVEDLECVHDVVKHASETRHNTSRAASSPTAAPSPSTGAEPSDLVEALRAYLERNPHRSGEYASWLAVALWAEKWLPYKPDRAAVSAALAALGIRRVVAA